MWWHKNEYNYGSKLVETADFILKRAKEADLDQFTRENLFLELVMLERAIDKIRVLFPHEVIQKSVKERNQLNRELDRVREEIWKFAETFDQDRLDQVLEGWRNGLRGRFIKQETPPIPTVPQKAV